MPRKLPPFVERWRDRHGKVRVYFRKDRGTRLPLPDTIGSDEFNDAYQAALLGQLASLRDRFARAAPGTIAAKFCAHNTGIALWPACRASASLPAFCSPTLTDPVLPC